MIFPKLHVEISAGVTIRRPPAAMREELTQLLTYENPVYDSATKFSPYSYTSIDPHICLLEDKGDEIVVPRGFDFGKLSVKFRARYLAALKKDTRVTVPVKWPVPLLTPNAEQKEMLEAITNYRLLNKRPHGNYLLVASTSTGKTITQALAAAKFGQRTLVLCKTNLIQKAWRDDLIKLFGLTKQQIGLIQQSKHTVGEQFTLSSLATLHRRRHLWDKIFSLFGTVILDECHLLPAKQIYDFVSACPAKYILGATATEKRADKKEFMVHAVFGQPVKRIVAVQTETASSMPITSVKEIKTAFEYRQPTQDLDFAAMMNAMIGDDKRNELIVQHVLEDWKKGNSVLITTSRVAHAQVLQDMLVEAGVEDASVLTGEVNQGRTSTVLIEMIIAKEIRCVVATDQIISTGANLPPLDRLHIAIPIVGELKLTQLLGRMRRKFQGKKDSCVRYYLDSKVPYLFGVYKRTAVTVFREMAIKPYTNLFIS